MAQQINLIDERLRQHTVAFGSQHLLLATLGVLGLGTLVAVTLRSLASDTEARATTLNTAVASLQSAASSPLPDKPELTQELAQLRLVDAGQQRIKNALQAGVAGNREGPSPYFKALARQQQDGVWITGLSLTDAGNSLVLEGRMADADALPDYLRRLNREPQFKGRSFAQLNLNGLDKNGGGNLPFTEFALRSRPATTTGP